jgi:hypothetical protein
VDSGRKGQLRQQYTPFLNVYRNAVGRGNQIAFFFCDLTKAYDAINHDILLATLNYMELGAMQTHGSNHI